MTGFGRGQAQSEAGSVTVEMRSVNNRFCEVSTRLPRELAEHESAIQARIKEAFERGRITVQAQIDSAPDQSVTIDAERVAGYRTALLALRSQMKIEEPLSLTHVLSLPDVFTKPTLTEDELAHLWHLTGQALDNAIARMKAMREEEGRALHADLAIRIDTLRTLLADVENRAPERVAEARVKLHERLAEILTDERIDRDRLEVEMAMLADRLDVTEECVRLHSHLTMFEETLASPEAVGRRLNFIAQEINREVNTIGSKANDAAVAHLAVRMKEELEKIREQVQNVE